MAYSEELAERIRDELIPEKDLTEREMFGGIGFMLAGNMCCGVIGDDLVVRVGADLHHDALTRPHAREFDFTGRPMKGWVVVGKGGLADDGDFEMWVKLGVACARSLPPKQAPKKRATPKKR
ncbi:MAG: TfoX/Sxy family protein [Actinobacteria bacterium]|nr:TfoX/Sxy family protein [Actinomycetota bacterium]